MQLSAGYIAMSWLKFTSSFKLTIYFWWLQYPGYSSVLLFSQRIFLSIFLHFNPRELLVKVLHNLLLK